MFPRSTYRAQREREKREDDINTTAKDRERIKKPAWTTG
jgi:hypothetical protein